MTDPAYDIFQTATQAVAQGSLIDFLSLHDIFLPAAGRLFSFRHHEYLIEPYQADAPFLVFCKGAQLGFSERAVLRAIHDCAYRLSSGLAYFFPTKEDVSDFSKSRFKPLLEVNPVLGSLVRSTDATNIKQIGHCTLFLRGLGTAISAKSIPVDRLVFDEVDEAKPEMVDLATKRLDHSEFQEIEYLSTPTIPDYGVDALWQQTDQRHRMLWCERCRTYTCLEMDFPRGIQPGPDGVKRVCKRCERPLDLAHPLNEYVPLHPGREVYGRPAVGYRISQLQSVYVNLDKIWAEYTAGPRFPQDFWNSRLAQAWVDVANRLDIEAVLSHCGTHGMSYSSTEACAIGVDVGPVVHHVVVRVPSESGSGRTIWVGTTDWHGLHDLIDRFTGYLVMDGLPEPDRAVEFCKRHAYRAWAAFYTSSPSAEPAWDDNEGKVKINLTRTMDASHRSLQLGHEVLPRRSDVIEELALHCHNVARRKVEDEESGQVRHEWVKLGPDHYRRAINFAIIASGRTPQGMAPPEGYYDRKDSRESALGVGRRKGLASSYGQGQPGERSKKRAY